ncbi:MAG: ankyrin repeat domain-containing protein [Candidatus Babeliales bacterium]|jgi:hypothetical protein
MKKYTRPIALITAILTTFIASPLNAAQIESPELQLVTAIDKGDLNAVEKLINEKDKRLLEKPYKEIGNTPLIHAVRAGDTKIVEYLLKQGADPSIALATLDPKDKNYKAIRKLLTNANKEQLPSYKAAIQKSVPPPPYVLPPPPYKELPPPSYEEATEDDAKILGQLKRQLIQAAESGELDEVRTISGRLARVKTDDQVSKEIIQSAFEVALVAATAQDKKEIVHYLLDTYYEKFLYFFSLRHDYINTPLEIAYMLATPALRTVIKEIFKKDVGSLYVKFQPLEQFDSSGGYNLEYLIWALLKRCDDDINKIFGFGKRDVLRKAISYLDYDRLRTKGLQEIAQYIGDNFLGSTPEDFPEDCLKTNPLSDYVAGKIKQARLRARLQDQDIEKLKIDLIQAAEAGDLDAVIKSSASLAAKYTVQKIKADKIAAEIGSIEKDRDSREGRRKYFEFRQPFWDACQADIAQRKEQMRPIDQHMETIVSAFQVALLAATVKGHEEVVMHLMDTYYKQFLSFDEAPSLDDVPAEIAYFMVKEKNPKMAAALKEKLYKVSRWKEKKGSGEMPYLDQPRADGISFALSEAIFRAGFQTCTGVKKLAIYIIDNVDLTDDQLREAQADLGRHPQRYEIGEHIQAARERLAKKPVAVEEKKEAATVAGKAKEDAAAAKAQKAGDEEKKDEAYAVIQGAPDAPSGPIRPEGKKLEEGKVPVLEKVRVIT